MIESRMMNLMDFLLPSIMIMVMQVLNIIKLLIVMTQKQYYLDIARGNLIKEHIF